MHVFMVKLLSLCVDLSVPVPCVCACVCVCVCAGFAALSRSVNGEVVETQLKLATQKWKARCKIGKQHQQQLWQDNEVSVCDLREMVSA